VESFCSDDVKELAGAMLKVQAEVNPAVKDAANPFAKSRYATLNSVIQASRDALLRHGVWVVQYPIESEPGHLGLVTKLTHASSGQWQSCMMLMPLSKQDPQGYGSAMTYARRYSIASMVGLMSEDDDGEAACGRGRQPNPRPRRGVAAGNKAQEDMDGHDAVNYPDDAKPQDVSALPALDGIRYQSVTAKDGQECVIATGNTMSQKDTLKSIGFKWNISRKIWWRYAKAA
jgi:hypothetical protein